MSWILFSALFFVFWWLILFATLPLGLRTQEEEGDITLGTIASAPRTPRMWRTIGLTTVITCVVMGALYVVTNVLGYSFDDIPLIIPTYR